MSRDRAAIMAITIEQICRNGYARRLTRKQIADEIANFLRDEFVSIKTEIADDLRSPELPL
jgi:hypothetical protein